MDTFVNKTIRLSEGETEMLMRALVEATEETTAPRMGDTQLLQRDARPSQPSGNTEPLQPSNFIL